MLALLLLLAQDVAGTISPETPVRLILKKFQTDAAMKENVVGDVLLKEGGAFAFNRVPPGKYDLLIRPEKEFMGSRWEILVEKSKPVSGISYRLTPNGSRAMIDEVIVALNPGTDVAKLVEPLGCKPQTFLFKDRVLLNIPDDKTVEEMIATLTGKPGVVVASQNGISSIR